MAPTCDPFRYYHRDFYEWLKLKYWAMRAKIDEWKGKRRWKNRLKRNGREF